MNKETPLKHKYWISVLQEDDRKLTEWEKEFIGNMTIKLTNGWSLTDKEEQVLEGIYKRKGGK